MSELLGEKSYFAEELSIAETQLYAAVSKSIAHDVFGKTPQNLERWCERMTARPAVKAAREQYTNFRATASAA